MTDKIKITVVGSGYVGLSLAVLLAQKNNVVVLDVDPDRVKKVNSKNSTVADSEIEAFLDNKELSLKATLDKDFAYQGASFIIVATPTNYNPDNNCFDTSSVDSVIHDALELNLDALVVIKSTIPVGHTKSLQEKYNTERVIFSPEFLREGRALKDNLYPSRIIVGSQLKRGREFANLLVEGAKKKDIEILFMSSNEAEALKLFANTYLAMRVAFFNELDSYALANNLDTNSVINGICLDDRIGKGYNNPSFGYGGYCLPKDTKQLLANYDKVPQTLIQAIVSSNSARKKFIADKILEKNPKVVGFYRLVMKAESDNFRDAAVEEIIKHLVKKGVIVIIYEPILKKSLVFGAKVISSLEEFKDLSCLIVANRMTDELKGCKVEVFTRDVFGVD